MARRNFFDRDAFRSKDAPPVTLPENPFRKQIEAEAALKMRDDRMCAMYDDNGFRDMYRDSNSMDKILGIGGRTITKDPDDGDLF